MLYNVRIVRLFWNLILPCYLYVKLIIYNKKKEEERKKNTENIYYPVYTERANGERNRPVQYYVQKGTVESLGCAQEKK